MSGVERARSQIVAYNAIAEAEKGKPVLAICYGAQIIASEIWPGSVIPTGSWNVGRTELIPIRNDRLVGDSVLAISVSYKERLYNIPKSNILAISSQEEILVYRWGNIIGILGHPEMPEQIVNQLIQSRETDLRYLNKNILQLTNKNLPEADIILNRFLKNE